MKAGNEDQTAGPLRELNYASLNRQNIIMLDCISRKEVASLETGTCWYIMIDLFRFTAGSPDIFGSFSTKP